MKVLIVSDTHRRDGNFQYVIEKEKPFDVLIHLGDAEGSDVFVPDWVDPNCRLEMVLGNNDFFSNLDREKEIKIGKYRILLTHGHLYNVSLGTDLLRKEAAAREFDIAMFGHTHRPFYEEQDGVILLNPGSLSYPRQEGRRPSYMIMNLDEQGNAHFDLYFIE